MDRQSAASRSSCRSIPPYEAPQPGGPLYVLVFGGSQGARVMSDIVPAAVELLDADIRARLVLTQQAREEDMARVRGAYERLGVKAELAPSLRICRSA
uniref:CAZy families GT28 protein n=1 Tax=uncultured Xanthobacter sp. TaxID=310608 RepID=A0A060BW81_9HYPH|nr:CAZy families GT28 protein [uncultured Xanthobacter sp.]